MGPPVDGLRAVDGEAGAVNPKKKNIKRDGYPVSIYAGYTTDAAHCPRCGAEDIALLRPCLSGQRIGVCHECGENYIVSAPRQEELCQI